MLGHHVFTHTLYWPPKTNKPAKKLACIENLSEIRALLDYASNLDSDPAVCLQALD
jgi:hypothetical protein